ncbi:MAG: glycosyltransferase family 4 protein [Candidatus Rokubacteria bacterium]|nr:glycosyltransferase family 4 protein [Candidatus Rokubacteria bacterium]
MHVEMRPLGARTGFHTFDRWRYNASVALAPPAADAVLGIDLDGFLWARRAHRPRFVVSLKGVIADEMTHERGVVRRLLGIQARWERANARRADLVVAPSRYAAETAARLYGLAAVPRVVPEPIDLAGWRARLAAAPRHATRPPTVLAVARMYPRKRLADLLEAARQLASRIPDLEVRIVGKGPDDESLLGLHARLGLGGRVRFLGDVSARELAVEYVNADVFCLPTVQESFGIVFAEAMAAGLPVVACRAAAVPEVVDDGRTGVLVTPRRPDELAAAIEALVHDADRRKELGEAGMTRVERFDVTRVAPAWLEVLQP